MNQTFPRFPLFFFGVETANHLREIKNRFIDNATFFFLLSPGSLLCRAVEGGGEKEKEGDTRQAGAFH